MCTLTVGHSAEGLIFTHNRDESVQRGLAIAPSWHIHSGISLLHPTDPMGGGTWWALDKQGQCAFLLNGGFEKHQRQLPYKHSRGLIPIQVLQYATIHQFVDDYSFDGLEPFTLVVHIKGFNYELVWTGEQVHLEKLNFAHWKIWASSTLYTEEWKNARKHWLTQWLLQNTALDAQVLWDFHHASFTADKAHDMLMERHSHLRTVSVTQLMLPFDGGEPLVRYEDRERHEEVVLKS